jgi:hypothetical protein
MVSEDSQYLGWPAKVHRLSNFRDLNETFDCQMPSLTH